MSIASTELQALEYICDRLSERSATLFLGAGLNYGLTNLAKERFPLGNDLADWIARDLLQAPGLGATLDETAEMARFRVGPKELNDYLYRRFSQFSPGAAHRALVQLPWDLVYTTNYDTLVEQASRDPGLTPSGNYRPVVSVMTEVTQFTESDIIYYKLHGSIEIANTEDGRLILTKEDFRFYDTHRKPLFKRLFRDLLSRTFVFVGYSLRDPNFRSILEDCRNELGTDTLPRSFAIRPSFEPVEETFWREKYNIQLVAADAAQFLGDLRDTWFAQKRVVVPFEERARREYATVDDATRFEKRGNSFYVIRPTDCTGPSNPKLFFEGREPSWGDIRDQIAPPRDQYWSLFDAIFPELAEPKQSPGLYLVTGAAGTGKTTLVRSLGFGLARDFGIPVLLHIPTTPLQVLDLAPLVNVNDPKRIVVLIQHAGEHLRSIESFFQEASRASIPVTIILEERKNQWGAAVDASRSSLSPAEFELGTLSRHEIDSILDALERHDALGRLVGEDRTYKVEHFSQLASKELLVALRELTSHNAFDEIVRDEYERIPSLIAKRAYVFVAALGQLDLAIRYETLTHLLGLRWDQLITEVFRPAEGVLISGEEFGQSRHNFGFRLGTRHPIIASVIFDTAAPTDDEKYSIVTALLSKLDPGYAEDRRLLEEVTRRRELVYTFASHDRRRAIYEILASMMPGNPFVFQHRSILERELGDTDAAVRFAREALKLRRSNPTLANTLGLALEAAARSTSDSLKYRGLVGEAESLFDEGIRNDPTGPYGYVGKIALMRQAIERERDAEKGALLRAGIASFVEDAYETTRQHPIIAGELARQREYLGDPVEAVQILESALRVAPTDSRLRDLLVRLKLLDDDDDAAVTVAMDGIRYDPTAWKLYRHIARIKRTKGDPLENVKGYYEAAVRYNQGNLDLLVELAAYLFMEGRYDEAREWFEEADKLRVPTYERTRIREWWKDDRGHRLTFSGRVRTLRGAAGWIMAMPDNFEAFFWRTDPELTDLREGDSVEFVAGFNARGLIARDVRTSLGVGGRIPVRR